MNQNRQPKGTQDGGQFAPGVNAESTVVLGDSPLASFAVGSVLSNGAKIVPWVEADEDHVDDDNDMVVQAWVKEWGDGPNDFSGLTVRYIATVMDEMGDEDVTASNLRDYFDDPDYTKVALRPDLSPAGLLEQVRSKFQSLRRDDER